MSDYFERIRRHPSRLAGDIFIIFMLIVVIAWTLFPLYWAFINSIKFPYDVYGATWIPWLQFEPTTKFWRELLDQREIRNALKNSLIISIGAATLALFLGTLAAYGLARFRFKDPSNGSLTTWFLSQRVLPPVIFVTPFYLLARELGLRGVPFLGLDSVWTLVLLNATFNLPFPVIILTQMFREIPKEIEEAAQVDGASRLEIFYKIALPLVAPGLVVAFVIVMAFSWNEYILAVTIAVKNAIPIPVIIAGAESTRGIDYQAVGTRTVLALLPPAIIALVASRYIIRGLSLGAVKG
ncbi:MAG: carbohydrate ABC transporter permease [Thermomicrobiales bacterium]|nr:carbohydrate ABC transporter permease [Thermomicrobiales bacterium]